LAKKKKEEAKVDPKMKPVKKKGVKGIVSAKREVKGAEFDPLTFTPAIVTVRQVPIVMAGVEYKLSTGPATFTPEDIMDFVASQDDPAIVPPRLKIGHESILSNTESADGTLKNFDDGVPSLGKFINISFDEDNIMAVGDLVTVRWLAEIMPLAYPNRSIEGFQEALTNTGHVWGLVVHAVALLGVVWPGVSTLDDLPLLYGADAPDGIEVVNEDGEEVDVNKFVAAARARTAAAPGSPVSAAVNVEDVRRQYYDSLNADQMWWWIRAIYIDPNELIVQDDDSGELFRVPFNVSGDTVEFSDPEQVQIQYVNVNAGQGDHERRAVALVASAGRQLAVYASRAESRPESNEQEDNTMRLSAAAIAALRARLGLTAEQLPDGATEAQISAAGITPQLCATLGINASEGDNPPEPVQPGQGGPPSDPNADPEEEGDIEEPGTGGDTPPATDPPPATAALPDGMIAVPATEWARVQQGTQAALARAETDENDRRDRALSAGLSDGRIRPADVPSYRNMHAAGGASREVFYRLLTETVENGGLAAGLVPVTERGALPAGDGTTQGDVNAAEYDANWLSPQERSRIEAIKAGTYEPPQVAMDDNYNRNGAGAGAR
jgi:hypothetical protein